jgi:AcrR family transcriptional regulator
MTIIEMKVMNVKKSLLKTAPPSRRTRRKESTRARIIKSALELLSRQEYYATTVEQITDAADVGKGTYFNYFKSKEHLLHEVGKEQVDIISTTVEKALAEQGDIKNVLRDLLVMLTKVYADNPILARNLIIANLGNDSARQLMSKNVGERARWLVMLIKNGQELGTIRKDLKPTMVAHWFLHTYFGNLMYWALQPQTRLEGWSQFSFEQFWTSISTDSQKTPNVIRSTKRKIAGKR